jgi:hypothetical protein
MPVGSSLAILSGHYRGLKGGQSLQNSAFRKADSASGVRDRFKSGDWEIDPLHKSNAIAMADMALELYQKFPTMNARTREGRFINALFTILAHPEYDQKRMIAVLYKQSTLVVQCPTVTHYIELLLGIYNRKLAENNRLRLLDGISVKTGKVELKEETA